jgi:hypothetical protein
MGNKLKNNKLIKLILKSYEEITIFVESNITINDIIEYYLKEFYGNRYILRFTYKINKNIILTESDTKIIQLRDLIGNENKEEYIIDVSLIHDLRGAGIYYNMEINIKFLKINENRYSNNYNNINFNLSGLSKLCFLKDISKNLKEKDIIKLNENIQWIIRILKDGEIIFDCEPKKNIIKILNKYTGGNIINFSNYLEEIIDKKTINKLFDKLNKKEKNELKEIYIFLENYKEYIRRFEKTLELAKKESIFEYSVISLVIIERGDFYQFKQEREKCPNRVDKILFHGTGITPISEILTSMFFKSRCIQHGNGVYFTDGLDNAWLYGGEVYNRDGKGRIPKLNEKATFIASSIYYNQSGFKRVYNHKYDPKKNEINFAYADCHFDTIKDKYPDKRKFIGTEYVINDFNQILPFISVRMKRTEYCIIWRDTNFSLNPIYNNEFDPIFKTFLKERMKYIEQAGKYNIYPCQTSDEALKLVRKKKYNKIILISNIGTDLSGKEFIINARKIMGNDIIVLFLAYNQDHLKWVKNFKNALFSNQANFYEKYLDCFYHEGKIECLWRLKELKNEIEEFYNIKFNFDEKFLDYPYYKRDGYFSELLF